MAKAEAQEEKKTSKTPTKTDTGHAFRILVKPILSEKSFRANALGQYVFKVSPKANKVSIRSAVEKVFDVHVTRVNIINVRGKVRNFGSISGRTSNWKKALVTLKKGESITVASN